MILSLEHTQFPWLVEWQLLLDAVPLRRRQLLESAKRVTKYGKVPQTAVTWAWDRNKEKVLLPPAVLELVDNDCTNNNATLDNLLPIGRDIHQIKGIV